MTVVYAFPPLGFSGWSWTVEDPLAASRSTLTGRRYATRLSRRRRLATLTLPGLQSSGPAWRRLEALKRLLEGGVHYVRLVEVDESARPAAQNRGLALSWTSGGNPLSWTSGGAPLAWTYDRRFTATATTRLGMPAVALSGLTAGTVYADAGERLRIGAEIRTLLERVTAAGDGSATARIDAAFTAGGVAEIGALESGIFEVTDFPSPERPLGGQFAVQMAFREVFADEIGDFTEIDPWR